MRIFSRYIFLQTFAALMLILSSLSGMVWIALALRQLDVVTSQGQDSLTLIAMTTLALPNLMAIIAPFSFLIASLHTLNRMNSDSELIIVSASGSTVAALVRPLLLIATLLCIALAFVAHVVQPWSMRLLKTYMVEVRTDLLTQVIQPGRFTSPERGLTLHIRDRAPNGELLGLVMHDTRTENESQSYLAERGVIVEQDEGAYLVMSGGHILRRNSGKEPPQIVAFDNYAISLEQFDADNGDGVIYKPRELYTDELWAPDESNANFKRRPGSFRAELHERIVGPLYPLAFVFIVIAFVGQARSTRSSRLENLVLAFVLAAGCRLVGLALNNLSAANAAYVPVVYGLPLGAIGLSLYAIWRGRRQRPKPAWVKAVASFSDKVIAWLSNLTGQANRKQVGAR